MQCALVARKYSPYLDRYSSPRRPRWLVCLTLLVILTNTGCDEVPKPSADSTVPSLRWNIFNNDTSESRDVVGSGTVDAKPGDSFRVSLIAEDPEGIHEITLAVSSLWSCSAGGLVKNSSDLPKTEKQTLNPDSKGTVLTMIFLIRETNLGPYACQSGFNFDGATVQFVGTGENYFKGITTADLFFKVSK